MQDLNPPALWQAFCQLNAIPRASRQEEQAAEFIQSRAHQLGLDCQQDAVGNVLVRKPAHPAREGTPTVALQSHLDMVHQKNADCDFDFATQGIAMVREGDWIRAQGTTLGADNGIGVAAMLAVLESKELTHPPLEALFTTNEESGMTGARGLPPGLLKAGYLLNLDTEDDEELTIGCAGAVDILAEGEVPEVEPSPDWGGWKLELTGLKGGHSGMEIHLGRGNANKLMNRLLGEALRRFPLQLGQLDGGGLRNAIPRESKAWVAVPGSHQAELHSLIEEYRTLLAAEYDYTDPELKLKLSPAPLPQRVLHPDALSKIVTVVAGLSNGIYRMSPEVPGLVQTSSNLARVVLSQGKASLHCMARGSVDSEKMELAHNLAGMLELCGWTARLQGAYPGWMPRPQSNIVGLMRQTYEELFAHPPRISACHAGLECGILGGHYPEIEMISFGPNIRGAHSPEERVQISSVEKFWKLLTATLERLHSRPEPG